MSKNLIPEIAKMLGVELGEEFEIKGREYIFHFVDNGLIAYRTDGSVLPYENCLAHFLWLINGEEEIVKMPWKPKEDTEVYTFSFTTHEYNSRFCPHKGVWYVTKWNWAGFPWQIAALDKGWIFRTKQEAEAALPAVAAEMGVEYEL